jgi:hypothetical protein
VPQAVVSMVSQLWPTGQSPDSQVTDPLVPEHLPFTQVVAVGQVRPKPPQLAESVSVSAPLQVVPMQVPRPPSARRQPSSALAVVQALSRQNDPVHTASAPQTPPELLLELLALAPLVPVLLLAPTAVLVVAPELLAAAVALLVVD